MKKTVLIATLFAALSFSLSAQVVEPTFYKLTVDDAVNMAIKNNISVKQSKLSLDMLEKQDKYSWNSISPSLSASGGISGGASNIDPTTRQLSDKFYDNGFSWSASASLNLRFTPALFTSIKAARLSYEAGEASYESTKRSIELSVRKSFYSLLYTRENITLQEAAVATARQTYEANQAKYNQGRLSELDLLTSQYNYESKKPSVDMMKNNYRSSLNAFKQVLGMKLIDEVELEGNLEELLNFNIPEEITNVDLNTVPAVKNILRNIETAKNSLQATKYSAWGPSVSANGGVTSKGDVKADAGNPSVSFNYGLNVSIPLDGFLPWSNGALSVENQETNLEKLQLELENTKTSTIISIENYYNAIIQAQNQLKTYENNVDLMQRTYNMSKTSYNSGSSSLFSLQTAGDNLANAKYNLQSQRYSIISAVLDLENILGLPFGSLNFKETK